MSSSLDIFAISYNPKWNSYCQSFANNITNKIKFSHLISLQLIVICGFAEDQYVIS